LKKPEMDNREGALQDGVGVPASFIAALVDRASDIDSMLGAYREELTHRFRRKEDQIIIISELERLREWLLHSTPGRQGDALSLEIISRLEEHRAELIGSHRRKEDQAAVVSEIDRYREWLLASPVPAEGRGFTRYRTELEGQPGEPPPVILDNRYEVISRLKTKSHRGCLYKARDNRLRCITAIRKILLPVAARDELTWVERRFNDEANLLFNLHHGGLPKVTDFFTGPDPDTGEEACFLVMTFIEGRDMENLMHERNLLPLPEWEAVEYFRQILDILSFLNSRFPPIFYEDMTPSNVIVSGRTVPGEGENGTKSSPGRVFLLDFGIARIISCREEESDKATPPGDLYALAAIVYFLLTGKMIRIDPEKPVVPEPIRMINQRVSERLSRIVSEIMENFASGRHDSPDRIIELLEGRQKLDLGIRDVKPMLASFGVVKPASAQEQDEWKEGVGFALPDLPPPARLLQKDSLHKAVEEGSLSAVEELLQAGSEIDARDESGCAPLHLAVRNNHPRILKVLISAGADINAPDGAGATPLHLAAAAGSREMAEYLVNKGADVKVKDRDGQTALHLANAQGHAELAEILMEAWTRAIYADEPDRGGRGTGQGRGVSERTGSMTELHMAAREGSVERVQHLLTQGFYPDPRNDLGWTPLHEAVAGGHRETVELLLSKGSNPTLRDVYGRTPLDLARDSGYGEIEAALCELMGDGEEVSYMSEDIWLDGSYQKESALPAGREPLKLSIDDGPGGEGP
jgi:ankyrin repeat protein/tRNA A-37 threonylcarbamoyl transferase component Bud32